MKKLKTIMFKLLSFVLSASILGAILQVQAAHADPIKPQNQIQQFKVGVLYEDSTFKITQTDNSRTVLNKNTHQMIVLTFTDSTHLTGIYKDINGNFKKYFTDASGDIYLDNVRIVTATRSTIPATNNLLGYTNPDHFVGSTGFTYYYVTTYYYNTKTAGDTETIALGILSLMPYFGPIFTVAGIIETARSFGASTLYMVEKDYCTSDYSHYAYKNYSYTDSNYSHLINYNITYQTMW